MTKVNEFVCPSCGHRWFDDAAYGTCDRCGVFFYLSETPHREKDKAVSIDQLFAAQGERDQP